MSAIVGKNYELPALDLNFAENKSLIDSITGRNLITFSRSQSGKEATYVGSDGLIKYASADEPRFDHDPVTGECLGLLIEEQRTNYLRASNDLTNTTYWIEEGTVVSLKGTNNRGNYYNLRGTNTSLYQGLVSNFNNYGLSLPLSSTATLSIDAKVPDNESGTRLIAYTIIATIGNTGGFIDNTFATVSNTSSATDLGNGWRRYSRTFTWMSSTSGTPFIKINPKFSNTENVLIANIQLEVGSFPTSYIPTRGAQVTRNADEATITGTNFSSWYNNSEGTLFGEFGWTTTTKNFVAMAAGTTGNGNNAFLRGFAGTNVQSPLIKQSLGLTNFSVGNTAYPDNQISYINGSFAGSTANIFGVTYPADLTIGRQPGALAGALNGYISRLTYWPKRLPDLELQQLTK